MNTLLMQFSFTTAGQYTTREAWECACRALDSLPSLSLRFHSVAFLRRWTNAGCGGVNVGDLGATPATASFVWVRCTCC